ncbi:hypothetical protein PPYR_03917 [Photinus pyralis]|uniref:Tyr recombinase domain-containing protein n=1 Tax=Photinus pyralis TaxID=7054 RepID=A0A5N4AWL7_PHOPY|nr:hypothetical protein PPYR_03917 [Photinus pyralis]
MIKNILTVKENENASKLCKTIDFLKRQTLRYIPKKSKVLIRKFGARCRGDDTIRSTIDDVLKIIGGLRPKKRSIICYRQNQKENWCGAQNVTVISENVLLAFFTIMSKSYKSSTLWKNYSMLRSMLNVRENIDISKFMKLQALLRRTSVGYEAKKSKILEYPEIERFINEAPNTEYLAAKVILIIGYSGACRREELKNLLTDDIDYKSDSIFVTPFHKATAQTLSRWIKIILQKSGVDVTKFSAYSTRHAATSAASRKGLNLILFGYRRVGPRIPICLLRCTIDLYVRTNLSLKQC